MKKTLFLVIIRSEDPSRVFGSTGRTTILVDSDNRDDAIKRALQDIDGEEEEDLEGILLVKTRKRDLAVHKISLPEDAMELFVYDADLGVLE